MIERLNELKERVRETLRERWTSKPLHSPDEEITPPLIQEALEPELPPEPEVALIVETKES